MTPLQACKETRELWEKLAEESVKRGSMLEKWDIPGPWIDYLHMCPCCEYAKGRVDLLLERIWRCHSCPMRKEWLHYSCFRTPCEGTESPYSKWLKMVETNSNCIDVEFFCLLIADLAKEAEERLLKE